MYMSFLIETSSVPSKRLYSFGGINPIPTPNQKKRETKKENRKRV